MHSDVIRAEFELEFGTIVSLPDGKTPGQIRLTTCNKPVSSLLSFTFSNRRGIRVNGLPRPNAELRWVQVDGTYNWDEVKIGLKVAFQRDQNDTKIVGYWSVPRDYRFALTACSSDQYLILGASDEESEIDPVIVWEGLYKENRHERIDLYGHTFPGNLTDCRIFYVDDDDYREIEKSEDRIQRFVLLLTATVLDPDNQQRTKSRRRA